MSKQKISKFRLLLNGVACLGISAFLLPIGISGIIGIGSSATPVASDPDGAGKVFGIFIFCAILGGIALISLIRTVMVWRRLPEEV